MKKWIKSLQNLNFQQKLSLPWDLCCIKKNRLRSFFYTPMKITHSLIKLCCFVLKQTWRLYRARSMSKRQNTKWRFKLIKNVTIFIALLKNVPLGRPDSAIPKRILKKNYDNCLIPDAHTQQPYTDNLCWIRALAVSLLVTTSLETSTFMIFNAFLEKLGADSKQFLGVQLDSLRIFEDVVEKKHLYPRYRHWRWRFFGWISFELVLVVTRIKLKSYDTKTTLFTSITSTTSLNVSAMPNLRYNFQQGR